MMELQKGAALPEKTLPPITREQLREYASASGDFNPIHLDEAVARKTGLPGIIAHGMLTAGFLAGRALELAQGWRPEWQMKRFQSRFRSMTLLGDVITISATVRESTDRSLQLDLVAKNQKGEPTTTASAVFSASGG